MCTAVYVVYTVCVRTLLIVMRYFVDCYALCAIYSHTNAVRAGVSAAVSLLLHIYIYILHACFDIV
jgi:hypothetical protein